jgi:hypothetical protein
MPAMVMVPRLAPLHPDGQRAGLHFPVADDEHKWDLRLSASRSWPDLLVAEIGTTAEARRLHLLQPSRSCWWSVIAMTTACTGANQVGNARHNARSECRAARSIPLSPVDHDGPVALPVLSDVVHVRRSGLLKSSGRSSIAGTAQGILDLDVNFRTVKCSTGVKVEGNVRL